MNRENLSRPNPDEIGTEQCSDAYVEQNNAVQHYAVLMEYGDCLVNVGKHDEAQKHYEKAAVLCPDAAGPYVGLGVVALQKNLLEDAEIAFRVACRLGPNSAKAYSGLAMVAQQRKNYEEAFSLFLKALDIEQDNMTALLGLFQTSMQMGSFGKIIHYLELYLESHPGDIAVLFALAALYMKDGRLVESRKILLDILALQPENKDTANLLEEVEHEIAKQQNAKVCQNEHSR
jgi:tetratricopeptide (TPR) repeat protein